MLKKVSTLQNGVIKTILKVGRMHSTMLVYAVSGILPVLVILKVGLVTLIYNHIRNIRRLNTPLVIVNEMHDYNTRTRRNIIALHIATSHYGSRGVACTQ
jgi:hypothetical protein